MLPGQIQRLIAVPPGVTTLDVRRINFQTVRNGDLVALANVVEHVRRRDGNPAVRFHITDEALHATDYCRRFRAWLIRHTDYFDPEPSGQHLALTNANQWMYRGAVGDLVSIRNPCATRPKIAVFPLLDAPYNVYRNWPHPVLAEILERFQRPPWADCQRVICSRRGLPDGIDPAGYQVSHDFAANLIHLLEAAVYVGGDTGMSHLAGVLDRGPTPYFYLHGRASELITLPLGHARRGQIVTY